MLIARKLAFAVLFASGAVMAQPAPQPPPGTPPPETPPPGAPPTPPPGAPAPEGTPPASVDLRVQQRPTLSPQDMLNNAADYQKRISEAGARIQGLVEQARKQKDIIRFNCLADKLVQVRANMNVSEKALSSLQEAVGRQDESTAFHEYTRLTIVNQNVQVLANEAEACVGEDMSYVGATRVDVNVEGVPTGDPTQPEKPRIPQILRPPKASPY
jgi:hypothetical protein